MIIQNQDYGFSQKPGTYGDGHFFSSSILSKAQIYLVEKLMN